MSDKFTYKSLLQKYSTDEACLEEIKSMVFPNGVTCRKCNEITKHYKIKAKKAYSCEFCGTQTSPLAGTIFHKSSTSLVDWFYAIYLMTQTRSGTSAKQLQRMLGVTYKTAWRMFKQIRMLMSETANYSSGSNKPFELLTGDVEIDETYVGGKGKNRTNQWMDGFEKPKEILMGMAQRGGQVYIKHIPNTGKWTLLDQIKQNVDPKARIHTDEWAGYKNIHKYGYLLHETVNHGKYQYVRGDVYTQNIENVWSHLKRGITGVYRIVSKKYLQAYADEYAFRYNHRKIGGEAMFNSILNEIINVKMVVA